MAGACIHLMNHFSPTKEQNENGEIFFNIGTGKDLQIRALAELIRKTVGYPGEIVWDTSRPNGTPRKLLDVSHIEATGWKYTTELEDGVRKVYEWFLHSLA